MGSIRPRILKEAVDPGGRMEGRAQVAVGSIRPRILKGGVTKIEGGERSPVAVGSIRPRILKARVPICRYRGCAELQWARSDRGY